ncbi:UNVERIFIED_CONTAM: hypothetical protein GTU68_042535, partial [Idotea baltica]|nr:hypothetical protein [Idotea baltica]
DLARWQDIEDRLSNTDGKVKVAIVGKYTELEDAYKSIAEALTHAGIEHRVKVEANWIEADLFDASDASISSTLSGYSAILVPGGFGERGTEGKIRAAQYARENKIPYFGICLGMQMAVIEAARNLAKIENAGSEEFESDDSQQRFTPVVYYLKEWLEGNKVQSRTQKDDLGGTMRLGAYTSHLEEGTKIFDAYQDTVISERHRHRYEVDISYRKVLEDAGLKFSGMSPDGKLPETIEYADHPWFIGVQYHPELKSKPFAPHPLFSSFVKAAIEKSRLV